MTDPLHILAVDPWYAGSHKDFLDGLCARSRHRIHPLTLPGRFWKWRQTGSGMVLAPRATAAFEDRPPDLIFASDFLHLPDFVALTRRGWAQVPTVLYFHENQLAYPNRADHRLDPAYPQANLSGAAVADRVWFNSPFHLEAFFDGLEQLITACPDVAPRHLIGEIRHKAEVMPLGVDLLGLKRAGLQRAGRPQGTQTEPSGPLVILWNHRWEHDKNPEELFHTLFELSDTGADFRLIVTGQRFSRAPEIFDRAHTRLARHIDHWGFVPDRDRYARLLARADLVVSLAHHDFFGVSVVEAMAMGAMPLLVNRVSYPDLVPEPFHHRCLVADRRQLLARLAELCRRPHTARELAPEQWVERFDWTTMGPRFDAAFERIRRPPSP